jgi:hypothetical protein
MRICVQKSTGKLIEAQGKATPGTLLANATAAGYAADDIEEKVVTDAEFAVLRRNTREAETTNVDLRRAARPSADELFEDLYRASAFSPEMLARLKAIDDRFPKHGMNPLKFDQLKK